VETASEDEGTCTCLVFKRKRAADVVDPSLSTSNGHAPSFKENPPSASSPRDLMVLEGGGESAPRGDHGTPPVVDLPVFLQQALKCFQNWEVVKRLGEDPLQDRATQGLGEFLIVSSLSMSKARYLQGEMAKLREESTLQAKTFSHHETALHQDLASLRQIEKETKRLLFEKSQEALQSQLKILPLRNEVIELKEKVEEAQAKMARLEERVTQREVQLGELEGELAQKIELFKKTEEELNTKAT